MAIEGEGVETVVSMCVLTGLTFVLELLRLTRLYTRPFMTRSYNMDDNVYVLPFVSRMLKVSTTEI